jgi:hypothetical protein
MENLSPQIAGGILIAAAVLAVARFAVYSGRRGDWGLALGSGLFVAVIGGSLVLAGMGTVPWQ